MFEHAKGVAIKNGSGEGLEKANAALEKIEESKQRLESGERIFKWGVKAAKVLEHIQEMRQAIDVLNNVDLSDPATSEQAAAAFDKLASGFGKLGKEAVPAGPWQAYFDFLAQFDSGLIAGTTRGILHNVRWIEKNVDFDVRQ